MLVPDCALVGTFNRFGSRPSVVSAAQLPVLPFSLQLFHTPAFCSFNFPPHQYPPLVASPVTSLFNEVSIRVMGHSTQPLNVWRPGMWVKVTESNWFCLQLWLYRLCSGIKSALRQFYLSRNQCQQNAGRFTQLNLFLCFRLHKAGDLSVSAKFKYNTVMWYFISIKQ